MDNVTHTMVGAAMGQAGLKHYSGLGMATLMIAANLPDVDAIGAIFTDSLAFRRGWTHGPLGLLVLPPLLVAAMLGWDRLRQRFSRRPAKRPPVRPLPLLVLAYIGILTHPFLDWLNNYGIRLLMPFSQTWFYGDAIFIIDPWIWLTLAVGLDLSRMRERRGRPDERRPALFVLVIVALYIALMVTGSRIASNTAASTIEERGWGPVERIMAGPVPGNPFRREIIYDTGEAYGFGTLDFSPRPSVHVGPDTLAKNLAHPAVREAIRYEEMQGFLVWSRFPFFRILETPEGTLVGVNDARFSRHAWGGWAARSVLIEHPPQTER